MEELRVMLERLLFDEGHDLPAGLLIGRAFIVFVMAILLVRLGKKRFLGAATAFDVVLGVIIGSVLSRAINGPSNLIETLVAAGFLIGLHWVFSRVAVDWRWFENLIKGTTSPLVRDGKIDWKQMQEHHISEEDLMGALRLEGHVGSVEDVREATLEQSGKITVLPYPPKPKVTEIRVEEGVQIVRIEIA